MTAIDRLDVSVYRVPTDAPEADGTLRWDATTVVVAEPRAGGHVGLGFTYSGRSSAIVIADQLAKVVVGRDPLDVPGSWAAMVAAIRNLGRPGVVSTAIAAVDLALWDLKAKLLGLPVADVLGRVADAVPVYGSGGFTTYDDERLCGQLAGWVHESKIGRVKMKIGTDWGREPARDIARVQAVRSAVGPDAEIFVDANGAYGTKQAVRVGHELADLGVTWFEEPVSSDNLAGLHLVRRLSAMDITAGEYGYDLVYFQRMCEAQAVDVVQADITRCAGLTEWMRVAAVAAAHGLDLSGHCAPSLHLHPACAIPNLRHLEFFHDHARLEPMLFDGVRAPVDGWLRPDGDRPGFGLDLKRADAERFAL